MTQPKDPSKATGGDSEYPRLSANGNWLCFASDRSDLVEGDVNGARDIFLYEVATGHIELVSNVEPGNTGVRAYSECQVSTDGRYVLYLDEKSGGGTEVILKDRLNGTAQPVGNPLNHEVTPSDAVLANDGSAVAFSSDDGSETHLVVYDVASGTSQTVLPPIGGPYFGIEDLSISGDGNHVLFGKDLAAHFILDRRSGELEEVVPPLLDEEGNLTRTFRAYEPNPLALDFDLDSAILSASGQQVMVTPLINTIGSCPARVFLQNLPSGEVMALEGSHDGYGEAFAVDGSHAGYLASSGEGHSLFLSPLR